MICHLLFEKLELEMIIIMFFFTHKIMASSGEEMETDTRLYPSGSTTSLSCITLGNESLNKPTNLTFLIKSKFEVIRPN